MRRILALAVALVALAVWLAWPRGKDDGASAVGASATDVGSSEAVDPIAAPPDADGTAAAAKSEGGRRAVEIEADEASRIPEARIAGRVVDDATGEPLSAWRFDLLRGEERLEELTTDDVGRFETRSVLPAGDYVVDLVGDRHARDLIQGKRDEAKRVPRVLPLAHVVGELVELAVPIGPTYHLRIFAPPEVVFGELDATLRSADGRFAFDHIFGDVRAGSPPWVRFGPLTRSMSGGPTFKLRLMTADGTWQGVADVEGLVGIQPGVVEVELTARGTLRGTVAHADGSPLAKSYTQLWGEDASFQDPENRPLFAATDEEGRYHYHWVVPGAYTLRIETAEHESYAEEVVIAAGAETPFDVRLVAKSETQGDGRISGRVVSRTGGFHGALQIALFPTVSGAAAVATDVEWEERDGVWSGAFAFEGLPREEHELQPLARGLLLIRPRTQQVRPDRDDVQLLVEDGGDVAEVLLRAVDAETGEAVPEFRSWLTVEPATERERFAFARAEEGVARFVDVPRGELFEYRVHGEGYANVWGDGATPTGGEAAELVVELVRGWSTKLTILGPEDEPLAGASIFLDDELAGITDLRGRLIVYRAEEVERLRVEYEDWQMVETSVFDPASGRFRSWQPWNRVQMQPPDG
ncbi:MAG: hypothetical protein O7B99_02785 [Planctomycetota bacterium]|nr:hypothetical protein [Planctomycetota bacterium]